MFQKPSPTDPPSSNVHVPTSTQQLNIQSQSNEINEVRLEITEKLQSTFSSGLLGIHSSEQKPNRTDETEHTVQTHCRVLTYVSESSKRAHVTWSKTHPAHSDWISAGWSEIQDLSGMFGAEAEKDRALFSHSFSWTIQRHRSRHCSFESCQQMGQRFVSPDPRLCAQTPTTPTRLCRQQPSYKYWYLFKTTFTEQQFSH